MTKIQKAALENSRNIFKDSEFSREEWERVNCGQYALQTAVKNGHVNKIEHVRRVWYTFEEVVAELNACSGADCYGANWNLQIEGNRAYEEYTKISYKMA